MAEQLIYLDITSPDVPRPAVMVEKVTLPGKQGSFMVLPGHAPLISALGEGDIRYVENGEEKVLHIKSGFVSVKENKVCACVEQ